MSPLTLERLAFLDGQAAYHRVAVDEAGAVAAFLLAFREGSAYDSPNYRWFAEHYERFLYVDRVVVSATHQGRGVGPRFYADLFAFAGQARAMRVTCEFDIDPPNEVSRRFHERHGFREVGSQAVAGGTKRVSLQAVALEEIG
ncbi:MAG TPA: GNAT family N-acetyltransferase [Burkholderiaceae bacterium]|nr:GNAT family N-acetyltransferase [Burkholderiaceae bacterium]